MANREEKILKIAEKLNSISDLFEMFPEKITKNNSKEYADSLRKIADELEKIK